MYYRRSRFLRVCGVVLAFSGFALSSSANTRDPKKIDFVHDIAPILKARCAECHINGKYKGSVSMDTREDLLKSKALTPGKSSASELVKRITSQDPEMRMPPKGKPLTAQEITLIKTWIDQGAAW